MKNLLFFGLVIFLGSFFNVRTGDWCMVVSESLFVQDTTLIKIPVGGNSWVNPDERNAERITNDGWQNWKNANAVFSTYIKVNTTGSLKVYGFLSVPEGTSKLRCTIGANSKEVTVSGNSKQNHFLGEWSIQQPGYIKIDISGVEKTGDLFAVLSELHCSGTAINKQTAYVLNNEGNYFYWGRRGPSVHLNYDIPKDRDIEWFYSEITVPIGQDPLGSYFMANGFAEGYFGIQVNSKTERRVLFSVWSPFKTDNPKDIPESEKIKMLKKGEGVYTGEFGNEGSGGQSYLKYNWKAGNTYKFLLRGKPVANGYTDYTAYFYSPEENKWKLIAGFSRPKTQTYLKRFHSFLENFNPSTGNISRKAFYHNQWTRDKEGNWIPVTKAIFTGDATAQKGYRMDYAGGDEDGRFFLRNCGFFNDNTVLKTSIEHNAPAQAPVIDLSTLE